MDEHLKSLAILIASLATLVGPILSYLAMTRAGRAEKQSVANAASTEKLTEAVAEVHTATNGMHAELMKAAGKAGFNAGEKSANAANKLENESR